MTGVTTRRFFFSGGLLLVLAGSVPFALADSFDDPTLGRPFGFLLQAVGLALCHGFFPPRNRWGPPTVALILLAALLPRAVLWKAPVSDDAARYRWEGNLVLQGENPFSATADDPSRIPYRNKDWDRMNHKDRGTVYPPLAQGLFALMAAVSPPLPAEAIEKLVFTGCDLGVLLVVLALLYRRKLPPSLALFYALNPIILVSFAGEAHYDSVFVLLLTSAVLALEAGRTRLSWLLLAASFQTKLISVVLAPIWLIRNAWKGIGSAALLIAVSWLPFAGGILPWLKSVNEFGGKTSFQGLIPFLLEAFALPGGMAAPLGIGLFLGSVAFVLQKGGDPATVVRRILAALLLSSPILHFWYLAWIIPFLALRPSLAWLWLCASQAVYFLVWREAALHGAWGLPEWAGYAVWIPFLLLGAGEFNRLIRRRSGGPDPLPERPTVGVAIPTLDVEDTLPACLDSLAVSIDPPDQCVVVDGGSTDSTVEIARSRGIHVIDSPRGRGIQIQRGIESLDTNRILILHADCTVHPEAVQTIRQLDRTVVGGGCGQRFASGGTVLTIVEFMNEGRAQVGESYWGDQGMFLRRDQRKAWEGLEKFPLMEDVELSRRLGRLGETRYLGLETRAGTMKWSRGGRLRRFTLVFGTVIRFRLATLIGNQASVAGGLYRRYYGS